MLKNRIYYSLKPILPARLRLALRRIRAHHIRKRCGQSWPIYEPSGRPPEGWPGWPEGKDFALVLSHDVEGLRGVRRCRQLAELEMAFGFRSSFNFIPDGSYDVPADLLDWLRANGFEVGLHDLRHDGTLFDSEEGFRRDAGVMNRYLQQWGAVGFRAGFMLHRLDWLHDLNIEYDASTFDVDPFEPQPDGVQTVFPFWVSRPQPKADAFLSAGERASGAAGPATAREGYIELPYTLSQDYNLFVVLGEKGTEIWRRKLKWLVEKRAMAFLDTHPDYTAMPDERPGTYEFSVDRYREFLEHVRTEYAGRYWHALPREVSTYCRGFRPKQARPPRQVAMLSYSFYRYDNRVRRYAETLARRGDDVRVFCLGSEEEVRKGDWFAVDGVRVRALQARETPETNQWAHAWRLLRFLGSSYRALSGENLPHGCELLHVHNIPDFLAFAGARLKRGGTKVILDIHDIVPEFYASKFRTGRDALLVRMLRGIEALSCRFVHHVIIANHIWKERLIGRSAPEGKVTALVNNVDLNLFWRRQRTRQDDRIILLYAGTLNRHQGLDLAIQAMGRLAGEFPKMELHIYGGGPSLPSLQSLTAELGLKDRVSFHRAVPIDQVGDLIASADIGIVPKLAAGFGDEAYSTKIMELMSQGLPVVLSRTRVDSLYFNDSVVAFFGSGDVDQLASAIRRVASDPIYRKTLSENGYAYAQANSWETMKHVYLDLVDRLTTTSANL
jgi:glycosyltransferase involved in cell wall biosynthesis